MKQIQPFQKHWQQITSIVVYRLNFWTDSQMIDEMERINFRVTSP